jgi:class 3 adenylate cyclase/DNA-binding NarL/FixJ family response regulator
MSKKNKPLIYLAAGSKVLTKILSAALEKKGYDCKVFTEGFSLVKAIISNPPALTIADKDLPEINGIELCKILKSGSENNSIPYILISTDDSIFDFWTTAREANRVVLVSDQNIDTLLSAVEELIGKDYIDAEEFLTKSDKNEEQTLVSWLVNAMDKSDFFLNMNQNIIQLYSFVKDTDYLVSQIFRLIYTACAFDGIALILDSQPAKVYISGTEFFEVDVGDEFWNICKAEYEQQAKKNHTITYEEKVLENVLLKNPEGKKYESYRSFTIRTEKDFIGTLHLASTKKRIFTYKVQSSIDFISPSLANLLQESLVRAELTQQEEKLRSAFSKFVPEEVINDFLNSNGDMELKNNNEKRNVVILMCDIRSFTSISEINQPENVVNFLNNYFTCMVNVVKKYGGTVDKFIGDAIMVLFGAPISYNDNAKRAVQAAIEMYSQLDSIPHNQLKLPEGVSLDIGIGIHSGDVIVGQIGSADKTSYTVIGDTVNLASRLEGLTKLYGAKVIISQAVRDELADAENTEENINLLLLDSVKVKGKKEAVFIYRVDEHPLPQEFTEVYEKGFKSYNEGAFNLAIPYFEKAVELMPQNKAARLMLERCDDFAVNKPENWDGAIALTSK